VSAGFGEQLSAGTGLEWFRKMPQCPEIELQHGWVGFTQWASQCFANRVQSSAAAGFWGRSV